MRERRRHGVERQGGAELPGRPTARCHLVKHHAEGVDIRRRSSRPSGSLFRCEVGRGPTTSPASVMRSPVLVARPKSSTFDAVSANQDVAAASGPDG